MATDLTTCPVCGREQVALARYPGYLCRECASRAATADGRPVTLTNTSDAGGFAVRYADSGELAAEETVTHVVYVDGLRCLADEGRVGGVVVQLYPEDPTTGTPSG